MRSGMGRFHGRYRACGISRSAEVWRTCIKIKGAPISLHNGVAEKKAEESRMRSCGSVKAEMETGEKGIGAGMLRLL